jgi:hypothetical protein
VLLVACAAHRPSACRDEEQAVVVGRTLVDCHLLLPLFHADAFRLADLHYRFQWDHLALGGCGKTRPSLGVRRGGSAGGAASGDEAAARRPTAADFGQFDPEALLELVDRMRLKRARAHLL